MSTVQISSTESHPRRKATWRSTPQRVWLRRAIFQVHLWVGLLLTIYAIVIGISGSALVFRTEIERHLTPQLYRLVPAGTRVSLEAAVRGVERDRPGWRVSSLRDFDKPTQATTLLLRRTGQALDANYRAVAINPYTGQVLADQMRFAGALGWLANLHFYLLAGKPGLLLSGYLTLGLVVLCLTGLVVWWPGVSRWRSALVLRRRTRWRRFNWDLHAVVGLWFSASLLLLSATGLYFAFPKATAAVVMRVTGSHSTEANEDAPKLRHAAGRDQNEPAITVDQAIALAYARLPHEAPPDYLALPSKPGNPFYVTGYYEGSAPYSQLVSMSFDSGNGSVLSYTDTRRQSLGQRCLQLTFALHFGAFAGDGVLGYLVKCLWVLAGLAPVLLAVTGVLMFWNRKRHALKALLRG